MKRQQSISSLFSQIYAKQGKGACGNVTNNTITSGTLTAPTDLPSKDHNKHDTQTGELHNEAEKLHCSAECCSIPSKAYQPTDTAIIQATRQQDGKKNVFRSFQLKWYQKYPWITLCTTNNKVFCYMCRSCLTSNQIQLSKNLEGAFTRDGFKNWKKAIERFNAHEGSDGHKEALHILERSNKPGINVLLETQKGKDQEQRRILFLKQLSSLRLLLRQGLAIRGHEETEGNLMQLLQLRSEDDPQLHEWMNKKDYLSPEIINECITLLGNKVLRDILHDIHEAKYFAILADETRDINNKEQLSICIRWVDKQFVIHEDFIGLVYVEKTTADYLTMAIRDILIRCSLPLVLCRGQGYDGASTMMGKLRGVATQIRQVEPTAIQVHCFAHSLNLCLQDAGKSIKIVRDCLSLIHEICQLIKFSPKRSLVFSQIQREISTDSTGLKPLCPTRWTVRTGSITSVINNYEALIKTFEEVSNTCHDDYGRRSGGVFSQLEKFETYFGLKLCHMVFSGAEDVSYSIQAKDVTLQDVLLQSKAVCGYLDKQRSDERYTHFYEQTVEESENLTEPPLLPRVRRAPRRFDDGSTPHRFETPKDLYRKVYFELLDLVNQEIQTRFDQKQLKLPIEIEKTLMKASNWDGNSSIEIDEELLKFYKKDLQGEKLQRQLNILADFVKEVKANSDDYKGVKQITTLRSLAEILATSQIGYVMLSEVYKLLQIYFTLPVTTSTAERSFSALRRLKNYLRSTMTQTRLNNCMILHCHKERTDKINLVDIAQSFTDKNDRRKLYFGLFI